MESQKHKNSQISLRHRSADVTVSLSTLTMLSGERAVKTVQPRATDVTQWPYLYIIRTPTALISARTNTGKHLPTDKAKEKMFLCMP
jgi:hypothetical protein